MKNLGLFLLIFLVSACSMFSESKGRGQIVYHWEKERTGIEKFSRDHSECLRVAESMRFIPDFRSWFYSEEVQLNLRADWHSGTGIWASYVQYPGAQPVLVNSLRDDSNIKPKKYRICMERRGYWHRSYNIPDVTNVYIYKPQKALDYKPSIEREF